MDVLNGFQGAELKTQLMSVVEGRGRGTMSGQRSDLTVSALDLDLGDTSADNDDLDICTSSWAIKTRVKLVNLNNKPWPTDAVLFVRYTTIRKMKRT